MTRVATVLLTGSGRGIGLEFARQYAAAGWRVIATARDPERADELRALARVQPARVDIQPLDVTAPDQIARLASTLGDASIDLLVNNAGWAAKEPRLADATHATWERAMAVNAFAAIRMAQTFVDRIAASEKKTIVTISSRMGSLAENTDGTRYAYRASKAAANMVVRTLAADLRPQRIVVMSLHPGWVRTRLGGSDAPLTVGESVTRMRAIIDGLTLESSGRFLDENGRDIPW